MRTRFIDSENCSVLTGHENSPVQKGRRGARRSVGAKRTSSAVGEGIVSMRRFGCCGVGAFLRRIYARGGWYGRTQVVSSHQRDSVTGRRATGRSPFTRTDHGRSPQLSRYFAFALAAAAAVADGSAKAMTGAPVVK